MPEPTVADAVTDKVETKGDATERQLLKELLHHKSMRDKTSNELVAHPIGYHYETRIRELVQKAKFHHSMMRQAQKRLNQYRKNGLILEENETGDIEQIEDIAILKKKRKLAKQNLRKAPDRKNTTILVQKYQRLIFRINKRIDELKASEKKSGGFKKPRR